MILGYKIEFTTTSEQLTLFFQFSSLHSTKFCYYTFFITIWYSMRFQNYRIFREKCCSNRFYIRRFLWICPQVHYRLGDIAVQSKFASMIWVHYNIAGPENQPLTLYMQLYLCNGHSKIMWFECSYLKMWHSWTPWGIRLSKVCMDLVQDTKIYLPDREMLFYEGLKIWGQ